MARCNALALKNPGQNAAHHVLAERGYQVRRERDPGDDQRDREGPAPLVESGCGASNPTVERMTTAMNSASVNVHPR